MQQNDTSRFFDRKTSLSYDERTEKIGAINNNIHLLIRIILGDLPRSAHILCVGVGTGSEIIALAEQFPDWRFTGIDPSAPMLDICRDKTSVAGLASRCEFVHGYLADLPGGERYDAILCLLVTHFIKDHAERTAMFSDMHARLKSGGYMINSEISYDMESVSAGDIMEKWKAMHKQTGATDEQIKFIPQTLRDHVSVMSPSFIEGMIKNSGFEMPVQFFQSILIHAWYSRKT